MHLAYLGNFAPEQSTENHLAWAMRRLKHNVTTLQEGAPRSLPQGAELFAWTTTKHLAAQMGEANQLALLQQAADMGIPSVGIHLDRWRSLRRASDVKSLPFFGVDILATADGGATLWYANQGIKHLWFPPAIHTPNIALGHADPRYACDIAFIGSKTYHPEHRWRSQLIRVLERKKGFRGYGGGFASTIRGRELSNVVASAKVAVGDSCFSADPASSANYWSDRIYEMLGRGAILVHPLIPGLDAHYTQGVHYIGYTAGSVRSLESSVKAALEIANTQGADEWKRRAIQHTLDHHTYTHRIAELLQAL